MRFKFLVASIVCGVGTALGVTFPVITDVKHLEGDIRALSSHRVYSIVQDSVDAVWISTMNGVDRFNGVTTRFYELPGVHFCGDMAARTIQLANGEGNDVWAYDNKGRVYRFSDVYHGFMPEFELEGLLRPGDTLNKLRVNDDGSLLLCLSTGLYVRDVSGVVRMMYGSKYVKDVCKVGDLYYLGASDGFFLLRKSASGGTHMACLYPNVSVETLFYDRQSGKVMVGTFNDGLLEVPVTGEDTARVAADIKDPVRSILRLDKNFLALGIDGAGVYLYDDKSGQAGMLINSDDRNTFSLRGNGIYALSKDSQGNLWAGSYAGGASLVKFTPEASRNLRHEKWNANSLVHNNVNAIAQAQSGDVWCATDMGVSFCAKGGKWSHCLQGIVCVSLCPLEDGSMAVGTYGHGLFVLDLKGRILKNVNKQNSPLTSNNIFSIKTDADGDVWIGAVDGNLVRFDPAWRKQAEYPLSPVFGIERVAKGRMAASTVNGFYVIDKTAGSMSSYATYDEQSDLDVSVYIMPMLFVSDDKVWLGTAGGGMNLYDMSDHKIIKSYKTRDGLPSNDVFSLLRDHDGNIWIGTGKGVAMLKDGGLLSLGYLMKSEDECNKGSGTVIDSGDVLFGTTAGAVCFTPSEVSKADFKATLSIRELSVEGLSPEEEALMAPSLFRSLEDGNVTLKHDQNSFTVVFEAIDLKNQGDIAYRYRLDDMEEDWRESLTGEASYKNLTPGSYTLLVESVHRSDGSVMDIREIRITVLEPWYNTFWAWALYAGLLFMAILWAIRHKLDNMQKHYYQDKIRLFLNTAHDIRTPVTLAMAPLEEAMKDTALSEGTAYLINTACRNVKKLNAMTSQLLDFERIDSSSYTMNWQVLDMREVLAEEVKCFEDACRRKGIELRLETGVSKACIAADINIIEHILDNLLSNACKYTGAGGLIKLVCRTTRDIVEVRISDSGMGIPKREHKYIFSEIYRSDSARNSQEIGTGFGLLHVKRLMEMVKGRISFQSAEGRGTEFTLQFKRARGEAQRAQRLNATDILADEVLASICDEPAADVASGKEATVMIVEDNPDMRGYLSRLLQPAYNVLLKGSADEAMAALRTVYPDIIISDLMMPGLQGDDFCDRLKRNPETAAIPVILLTAKADHESVARGLKKGADDYITKPFSAEILRLKVDGILGNRRRLQQYLLERAVEQVVDINGASATETAAMERAPLPAEELLTEYDRDFIKKATAVVIANLGDPEFSIDRLCREMAMSRTLFYGRLKSLTGKAPQEFIRLLRLERAAELLSRDVGVNEVAIEAGFANVKYFSTVFKKHFGVQPSKYAKGLQAKESVS